MTEARVCRSLADGSEEATLPYLYLSLPNLHGWLDAPLAAICICIAGLRSAYATPNNPPRNLRHANYAFCIKTGE